MSRHKTSGDGVMISMHHLPSGGMMEKKYGNLRNLRLMMDAFLFLMLNTHITQTNRLIESNQGPPNPPRGQEDSGRQGLPCLRITIIG